MIGTTIGGKYSIVRQLGEGGMGAVYEARHTGTGRRVAIKVITGELGQNADLVARFEVEARAAGAIESEHIAQVLDVGHDEARKAPFLAMEFLVGEDLQHLFDRLGTIPADLALRIGVQACLGLEKAHEQGIVHRDIKPANLFLAERDGGELRVKLLDFGIAKITASALEGAPKKAPVTRIGSFLGSPLYMSPEQTRASAAIDHRSDIWSLGIVLYQGLAGRTPFHDVESLGDFIVAVNTTKSPPIRNSAPWVDPAIAAAVERALAIDPAHRYQSAAEMREAFEAFLPQGTSIRKSMVAGANGGAGTPLPISVQPSNQGPTPRPSEADSALAGRTALMTTPVPPELMGGAQTAAATPWKQSGEGRLLGAAPVIPEAPRPPQRASNTPLIALIVALALAGGGLAAAFGLGWIGKTEPAPIAKPSAPPPTPVPSDSAPVTAELGALLGPWWSEIGVAYDAVMNSGSVEFRIRDVDDLAAQGYVAGDTHFALRALPGEAKGFRVAARIRPLPPKGTVYDKARARTTCENTWRQVGDKQLHAKIDGDKLTVSLVRIDPPASAFLREGLRVVGCTRLEDAPAVEVTTLLSRTAPPAQRVQPVDRRDAGAAPHDAGAPVDAGGPIGPSDAGAPPHDAGAPPPPADAGGGGGGIGAHCTKQAPCSAGRCLQGRCQVSDVGTKCTTGAQCTSNRCINGTCR